MWWAEDGCGVTLELSFLVAGTKQKGAHSKGTALCGMHSLVPCTEEGTHMVIEMFGLASKVWLWIEPGHKGFFSMRGGQFSTFEVVHILLSAVL